MKNQRMFRHVPALAAFLAVAACGGAPPASDAGEAGGAEVAAARAEATPALALVARSVAFHDPGGVWGREALAMSWVGTDGEGGERVAVSLRFGADEQDFALSGRYRGAELEYETTAEGWSATVDGIAEPDLATEDREAMRLHREEGMFWRSYYGFLAGLPMKIADPGAHVEPNVLETTFLDRPVEAVKVTYDPEVGGDTWYFYFDPATAELVGCRFFHDESANDGEYITFEELVEGGGLRLPRLRAWYVNADGRHLGTDEVGEILVDP